MKRFLACLSIVLALAAQAAALTVVPRSFDDLVARADTVFDGTVTRLDPRWIGEGTTRHIVTFVTFRVEETFKGDASATQTLRFFGGTIGGTTMSVPEMPTFAVGQRALLFVTGNGSQFCPLVGVQQGRFHVTCDAAGVTRITTDNGLPVVHTADLGQVEADGTPTVARYAQSRTPGMTLDQFRAEIRARVAASGGTVRQQFQP